MEVICDTFFIRTNNRAHTRLFPLFFGMIAAAATASAAIVSLRFKPHVNSKKVPSLCYYHLFWKTVQGIMKNGWPSGFLCWWIFSLYIFAMAKKNDYLVNEENNSTTQAAICTFGSKFVLFAWIFQCTRSKSMFRRIGAFIIVVVVSIVITFREPYKWYKHTRTLIA